MLAAGESDFDGGLRVRGKSYLRVNHGLANGLHGFAPSLYGLITKIQLHVAGDVIERDADEKVVNVVATEMRVAVRGDDFEDALMQFEDGDIERAAAEIVDSDDAVALLVEPIGERRGRRLVDEAQ